MFDLWVYVGQSFIPFVCLIQYDRRKRDTLCLTFSSDCPFDQFSHAILETSNASPPRQDKARRLTGLPTSTSWSPRHFDDRCTMAGSWATGQVRSEDRRQRSGGHLGKGDAPVSWWLDDGTQKKTPPKIVRLESNEKWV
ncbi:hypothetical protein RRG08_012933 [Elysia crispata]|uniref:Uncharacterized protein n=1 Tax=Elysia crispata TaxID=231223 RepID=A0AAE0ZZP7_9GAST|nr:hypothetical protein RRG08_012933 [Elysia crispata]